MVGGGGANAKIRGANYIGVLVNTYQIVKEGQMFFKGGSKVNPGSTIIIHE